MAEDKRGAILLGATSGIGREMALWLAARGWRVGVAGRRKNLLDDLHAGNREAFVPRVIDVDEPGSLLEGLEDLARRLGDVELLAISSGTGFFNPGLDDAIEQQTVSTNVAGFTMAADWGYRHFKQRGKGRLAAITSVAGLLGSGEAPAYSASKAYQIVYLNGLWKRSRKEAPKVSVTDIRPGSVKTAMMKGSGHFWIGSPEAAADVACRAILKGKRLQYVTPRWILVGWAAKLLGIFA